METTRMKIMKKLMKFNQNNGVAFLSKEEATRYYRELVDLIYDLLPKEKC